MTALLALVFLQADARALVEKLRSDKPEEREDAERDLRKLGKAARPELERAAKDSDDEVRARARVLLGILVLEDSLSPKLQKAMPGIAGKLARGEDSVWTETFLEAASFSDHLPLSRALTRDELEVLAPRAARGARTQEEREEFCEAVLLWRLRGLAAEILPFLEDAAPGVRRWAGTYLLEMDPGRHAERVAVALASAPPEPVVFTLAPGLSSRPELVPPLLRLLETGTPAVRRRILDLLPARDASLTPALLPLLRDSSPEARSAAIERLRGRTEAVPELRRLLREGSPDDRQEAASALLDVPDPPLDDLLPLLQSPDPLLRSEGVLAAGRLPPDRGLPLLRTALADSDPQVRLSAVHALKRPPPDLLTRLFTDPIAEVRAKAVELLGRIDARDSAEALRPLFRDPSGDVREKAFRLYVRFRGREAVEAAAALLDHEDANLRQLALEAIARFDAVDRGDAVLKRLEDPEPDVRIAAAEAASRLRLAAATPKLLSLLDHEHAGLRRQAGEALLAIQGAAAVPLLKAKLRGKSSPVGAEACISLLGQLKAGRDLLELFRSANPEEAPRYLGQLLWLRVAEAAGPAKKLLRDRPGERLGWIREFPAPEDGADLRRLLRDPKDEVRLAALETLHRVEGRAARPEIRPLLKDGDYSVRVAVVRLLNEPADLLPMLEDDVSDVREAAADGLVRLGHREALPALLSLLEEPSVEAREAALRAVECFRPEEALPLIRKMLKDDRDWVVDTALAAFVRLRPAGPVAEFEALLEAPTLPDRLPSVLVELGRRDSVPVLRKHLTDASVAALARFGAQEAIPDLARALTGPESAAFVDALLDLDAREAVPALRGLLRGRATHARAETLRLLRGLGVPLEAAEIDHLLDDEDHSVRSDAVAAMAHLKDVPRLVALLDDSWTGVSSAALDALVALRAPEAGPRVLRLLEDLDRDEAAEWAAALGLREAIPSIRKMAAAGDFRAAEALKELEPPAPPTASEAPERLLLRFEEALRGHPGPGAGLESPRIAGMIVPQGESWPLRNPLPPLGEVAATGDRRFVPLLIRHIRAGWSWTRPAAVDALARLGGDEARTELVRLLVDPDREIRRQAAGHLVEAGHRPAAATLLVAGGDPSLLNALRDPAAWARLREAKVAGPIEGTEREVLEKLAGFPAEGELRGRRLFVPEGPPVLEALGRTLGPTRSFVLEGGRLRVLPRAEAARAWR